MVEPYFSVIIPTLNEEKFLPKLLNDLKRQKEKNFEVIIVDGSSEDKTRRVAESYKSDFLNFKIVSVKKRNVSYQRNLGARLSKGVYLIFLDADSRINPAFTRKIKREIDKKKYLIFIPLAVPQSRLYQDKIIFNLSGFLIEVSQLIGKPFSAGGSMVFQKDFFHFIGGFNEKLFLSEDHEIIQRARKCGVIAKVLRNVKIKFSLRRLEKEGRFDILVKYLIATIHLLIKGEIKEKIFDYQMGGADYQLIKKKSPSLEKAIKKYFRQLKKQVKQLVAE